MAASAVLLQGLGNGVLWDQYGNALNNHQVYVYQRGTTTQVPVYSDSGLTVSLSQPLTTGTGGAGPGGIPGYVASGQSIDFYDATTTLRQPAEPLSANAVVTTVSPSGGDDLPRLQAVCNAGGRVQLGPGTFKLSGLLTVPAGTVFQGIGSGGAISTLQCTAAAAGVRWGGALGTVPVAGNGEHGRFRIDGNNVATGPLALINCVEGVFTDLEAINSVGDGVVVAGQNCTFISLNTGGHGGDALALDNGTGGNVFLNCEMNFSKGYHIAFRESVVPPANSYAVPENNYFYGGICEGALGGVNLGCVHALAGNWNRFTDFNFFSGINGTHLVFMEQNTVSGRSGDNNGNLSFRDCFFSGGGGIGNAIQGGTVAWTADLGIILQGQNIFSSFANAIYWPTANSPQVEMQGETRLYTVTTEYNNNGTGPNLKRPLAAVNRITLTDAATVNIDASTGNAFILFAGGSRTIAAPTNPRQGQEIVITVWNNTAGAITTTWNATYHMAAWTDAAAGKQRVIRFMYDGANWNELGRTTADY